MPLPSSSSLWTHVNNTKGLTIQNVGGNIKGLGNYCAVRLSYALTMCGHPITIKSDYKDKNGNSYIIKTLTMEGYLDDKYKKAKSVGSIKGLSGIVFFKDCGYSDASGHVDVVVNGNVADKDCSEKAKTILFWEC